MYKKDFDLLLKSAIPKAAFLWGECDFLIDFYGKKLKNLARQNGEIDTFSFYFEEYSANMVRDILSQQSLFSQNCLVLLKLNKIKDAKKKAKDTEFASFLEIIKSNPNNYLIIEFYNDDSSDYGRNAKAISAIFNTKDFVSVRFFNPTQNEANAILRQISANLGVKISDRALNHLYELQNHNLGICANELHKFALFDGEITKERVDSLSFGLCINSIEELCEAILDKRDFVAILSKMQEEGLNDMDLIRALQGYFYRLFLFFAHAKIHGKASSLEILKYALPKQIEEKYTHYALKLREMQFLGIFALLNEWRVNAISGKDKNSFLNLIKLQAIIK